MVKFGNIKRQHGRIEGLDRVLDRIMRDCPHVSRIVPGRMGRKRGNTPARLKVQYATNSSGAGGGAGGGDADGNEGSSATGLKCIYTRAGSWQEVFLICDDADAARHWLKTFEV